MSNDERRELDRKVGQELLKLEGDQLEKYIKHREYERRNLKYGDNVVHLQYNGMLLPSTDVVEFEKELASEKIALSYFDDSKSMSASIIEFIATLTVTAPVTNWILSNVAWEVIWKFFLRVVQMTFEKISQLRKNNPDLYKNRDIAVGIMFEIKTQDGKDHVNFVVGADADPKQVKESRKTIEVIMKQHIKGKRYEQWRLDKEGKWNRDTNYDIH